MKAAHKFRDQIMNADPYGSAQAAMAVIDKLQSHPPGEQVIGIGAAFVLLCNHYGVHTDDAVSAAEYCIRHTNKRQIPEFRAVEQYVQEELPK